MKKNKKAKKMAGLAGWRGGFPCGPIMVRISRITALIPPPRR